MVYLRLIYFRSTENIDIHGDGVLSAMIIFTVDILIRFVIFNASSFDS
jgi:hypothetical protein